MLSLITVKKDNPLNLEIHVSQNLEKLGGGGGWGKAHKMSIMEGGENWSKLGSVGRVSFNTGSNIGR